MNKVDLLQQWEVAVVISISNASLSVLFDSVELHEKKKVATTVISKNLNQYFDKYYFLSEDYIDV